MKFKVMSNFLLEQIYSDRRGNEQKPPRTKPYRQKTPGQNPRTKTPQIIEREFVQEAFVRVFCTRPTKNGGVRDVWRTFGGSRDVWHSV